MQKETEYKWNFRLFNSEHAKVCKVPLLIFCCDLYRHSSNALVFLQLVVNVSPCQALKPALRFLLSRSIVRSLSNVRELLNEPLNVL